MLTLTIALALLTIEPLAAVPDRAWQTGTWLGFDVVRPKVVFGVNRAPNAGSPAPAITEIRTYVIETDALHLELKETTTADATRIDVIIGAPVTFALEKKLVYVKLDDGRERQLTVTKTVSRTIKKSKPDADEAPPDRSPRLEAWNLVVVPALQSPAAVPL